jgi:TonB family protein
MRLIVGCTAAIFALLGSACAQDKAADRMHRAIVLNSIDDAQMKPWHLKLSFQLFDTKGLPTEKGTVEEWWVGPSVHKTVYSSPSYTSTEMQTKDGFYRTKGVESVPRLLDFILRQVVHPMPSDEDVEYSKPILRQQNFGKLKMDCFLIARDTSNIATEPVIGFVPTYCFDLDQDVLRLSYAFVLQATVRNRVGEFQNRKVVVDQTTSLNSASAITAHIETLELKSLANADLLPSEEMEKVHPDPRLVPSTVLHSTTNRNPSYPYGSRANHVSGSVVLSARIGPDGRVNSVELISSPAPDLSDAALKAVRQWTYKPYLRNGEPIEVKTIITINFDFGSH